MSIVHSIELDFFCNFDSLCPLQEYIAHLHLSFLLIFGFLLFSFSFMPLLCPPHPLQFFFSFYRFGSWILSFLSHIVSFQYCNMNFSYQRLKLIKAFTLSCTKASNLPSFAHDLTLSPLSFLWLEFLSLKDIF